MIAAKQMDIRANIKKYFDEAEYNEMAKAKRNAEYLAMLDERIERLNNGEGIHKTLDELRNME